MADDTDLAFPGMEPPAAAPEAPAYRVLARKYRPASFDTLLGQDAMVKTLANAIARDRLAQAWLLTGVRGVGKTSTARIIAKALNCIGPDGQGGPTIAPCGVCEPCVAIAAGRHIDVIEMDAASNTGIDDIREIIEAVRYATVSARFKIYIIDEVHMLSKPAFNGLLKTLEEPPPHVKFIFATTEVQKIPVTVLSRCQRFDLRRVPADTLVAHFAAIVTAEGATAEPEALALIARAAEGSVRDGLSVLDQAIAHSGGEVTADAVRDMLGLADRGAVRRLFGLALAGDAPGTLAAIAAQYDLGLDPEMLLRELLDLVHAVTRARLAPADDPALSVEEKAMIADWAERLSFPALHRLWQLLLKGLAEVQSAPVPLQAAEMALLRLIHASDLPDPANLVRRLTESGAGALPLPAPAPAPSAPAPTLSAPTSAAAPAPAPTPVATLPLPPAAPAAPGLPQDYPSLVALFRQHNEARLHHMLTDELRLVRFAPGAMTLASPPHAARDQLALIGKRLAEWTGTTWTVDFVASGGAATLREAEQAAAAARIDNARADPTVAALFTAFPDAEIIGFDPDERTQHAQSR
ncbi:DNA polymerase III subunit gamma/tau [Polymorphobacter fuscus]|uniref:DNA polymerase III subunit gamma/tau n=1 Tax=Sandarakinorhabdus fusca TaxID=1439888 RepID=A0A7C9KGV8_9SPHN|nr:DNA polymerase III subunit gamma/tau [Polymorphobacter fuscus]KAB7648838.1 DNA polymerase III subunit gamma/tau [Polymorphobacter fuscus]MQT16420.1 DNA polymerase III subunit gamma/tau [Polymorphobacter fuscus]NJC07290.1 DNA polymerase-3 subunit gamma/tau [Polymorphobacter fuscus]